MRLLTTARRHGVRLVSFVEKRLTAIFTVVRAPWLILSGLWSELILLLGCLVHGVQDAEVMLCMLEIALGHHAVSAAGRIPAKLQVLLEKLLRRAADSQIGSAAVKHMVSIEWNPATMMAQPTAAATAAAGASAISMTPATHAFHVHFSCCLAFFALHGEDANR